MTGLRRYHAAVWDEPLVMEMGSPGRRGVIPPPVETAADRLPPGVRREAPPRLPELSEFEVQRHYLHLSQQTLGMMGVNLFGTCTMKYNPRLNEALTARPWVAELHPQQDDETLQGVLAVVHGLDTILRELSGMARFIFQPGGGAACDSASDCCRGLTCEGSVCCTPRGGSCTGSSDCCTGMICNEGVCARPEDDLPPGMETCGGMGGTCCAGFTCT